jgi:hypothetical protein
MSVDHLTSLPRIERTTPPAPDSCVDFGRIGTKIYARALGAGTNGVWIDNWDGIYHTFTIEELDVDVELPALKSTGMRSRSPTRISARSPATRT